MHIQLPQSLMKSPMMAHSATRNSQMNHVQAKQALQAVTRNTQKDTQEQLASLTLKKTEVNIRRLDLVTTTLQKGEDLESVQPALDQIDEQLRILEDQKSQVVSSGIDTEGLQQDSSASQKLESNGYQNDIAAVAVSQQNSLASKFMPSNIQRGLLLDMWA